MKKILISSLTAVSAVGLLGGGTFAAWSDYVVNSGNESGADHLTLKVNDSSTALFDKVDLAPGVGVEREFVIASREGNAVPTASLRLAIEDLIGIEDGCTSTSEGDAVADGGDGGSCTAPSDPLVPGLDGQFIDEARISINSTQVPTTDLANACNSSLHRRGGRLTSTSLRDFLDTKSPVNLLAGAGELSNGAGSPLLTEDQVLEAGEGVCVGIVLQMPETATNASQGDNSTFSLRFLLDQIV